MEIQATHPECVRRIRIDSIAVEEEDSGVASTAEVGEEEVLITVGEREVLITEGGRGVLITVVMEVEAGGVAEAGYSCEII